MKYIILTFLLLFGCSKVEQHENKISKEQLVLGKWVVHGNEACMSRFVEYYSDGNKFVKMNICDENGKLTEEWYKSKWEIQDDLIIETTFEVSDSLMKALGITLPHIETDKLEHLDKTKLVIVDDYGRSVYSRPD